MKSPTTKRTVSSNSIPPFSCSLMSAFEHARYSYHARAVSVLPLCRKALDRNLKGAYILFTSFRTQRPGTTSAFYLFLTTNRQHS